MNAAEARRYVARLVLLVAAYLMLGWVAFHLGDPIDYAYKAVLWPPTGVGLAALLVWGRRLWPAIFFGELLAHTLYGVPRALPTDLAVAAGHTLGAVAGVTIFRRLTRRPALLRRPSDVAAFLAACAAAGPLVSAVIGALAFTAAGITHRSDLAYVVWAWWSGDLVIVAVLTPWLLAWREPPTQPWTVRRVAEFVASAAVLVAVSGIVFAGWLRSGTYDYPLTYLPVLVIAWIASRFGFRGATSALLLSSTIATWGTLNGHGPFARPSAFETALMLQSFLLIVASTTLLFSAFIIDRRRAEIEAAQQAAALEKQRELDAFKNGILDVTTHELRTPLAVVVGNAELLEDMLADRSSEHLRQLFAGIRQGTDRLGQMIDELLLIGGLSAGKPQLDYEALDVQAALLDVVEPHLEQAREKGVDLRLVPAAGPVPGIVDRERFAQALDRVVHNAIKFTPAGGRIEIAAAEVRGGFAVEVRDTGIGIAPEHLARVFDRFFQVEPSLTRARGGAGLGLAIARVLVEAHGGRITVASEPGGGSAFTLWFPGDTPGAGAARPGSITLVPERPARGPRPPGAGRSPGR